MPCAHWREPRLCIDCPLEGGMKRRGESGGWVIGSMLFGQMNVIDFVGASLLAMTVGQATLILSVLASS
jgi:hypothetical protein